MFRDEILVHICISVVVGRHLPIIPDPGDDCQVDLCQHHGDCAEDCQHCIKIECLSYHLHTVKTDLEDKNI